MSIVRTVQIQQKISLRLSILGMSCAGCVSAVEGALASVDGVIDVSVNFADHSAVVIGNADSELLKKAVQGCRVTMLR